jgi:hypothetical protein
MAPAMCCNSLFAQIPCGEHVRQVHYWGQESQDSTVPCSFTSLNNLALEAEYKAQLYWIEVALRQGAMI